MRGVTRVLEGASLAWELSGECAGGKTVGVWVMAVGTLPAAASSSATLALSNSISLSLTVTASSKPATCAQFILHNSRTRSLSFFRDSFTLATSSLKELTSFVSSVFSAVRAAFSALCCSNSSRSSNTGLPRSRPDESDSSSWCPSTSPSPVPPFPASSRTPASTKTPSTSTKDRLSWAPGPLLTTT